MKSEFDYFKQVPDGKWDDEFRNERDLFFLKIITTDMVTEGGTKEARMKIWRLN